ncbi:NADH dehydrogenase [ubiquinone] 1 alpha subcomplex assembly factor 8 isoform X3 [Acinonyx jubatus]|uniref:NADH dehydrogenase [ubiquinone] 1 alpha subcomplex assembly factor 8 isoform X3 n=1 Tax=Acinonyx jubatus TaxID=32536 RepID=A0ABM3P939_ACIJB|nr:NADH dehydrogenase [ubiquinone] 1 alpha subcomplex assembly factor 8 isoform X3 [Acinonyx jubatus]
MSGNGAVWGRVRGRLRAFPERLAACRAEAAAYGRCVQASTAPGGRLTKDLCVQEFKALRSCFAAAMSPQCVCCPQEPSAILMCHSSQKAKTTPRGGL